jgi:glycopeptide antibiotics resistance protein
MCLFAVYGNLIPLRFQPQSWSQAVATFREIPFIDPFDVGARGDWVISVWLFTALSYLLMGALCVDRPWQVGLAMGLGVVAFCGALSVAIEFVQIFFPPRTVSLNDILVEILGAVAGTVLWLWRGQRITNWARRLEGSLSLAGLARRLLPGYLALLLIAQLMPFDFTVSTSELVLKYQEDKIWLVPFASIGQLGKLELLTNMAAFLPLGFLRALGTKGLAQGSMPLGRVLRFGVGVASLIALLQLFVYSRIFDTTTILTGTAAVWLGWQLAWAWRAKQRKSSLQAAVGYCPAGPLHVLSRRVATVLFAAWLGAILYINWKPFDFTRDPAKFNAEPEELPIHGSRRLAMLPLVDYYWGSKYQALDQFLKKTGSFLPFGILAALAMPRLFAPGAAWRVLLPALVVAAVVESGRYFLPSRTPSITDLLIQCFGAWLGFVLTRHIRVILWAETALPLHPRNSFC